MAPYELLHLIAEDAIEATSDASNLFLCRVRQGGIHYARDMICEVSQDGDVITIETTANNTYTYTLNLVEVF